MFRPNKHQTQAETSEIFDGVSLVKRSRRLTTLTPDTVKEFGRLCLRLVFVWAEHRKILPYAKSDRHERSPWSRLAADEVREHNQHDQPVGVRCSRSARLFLIIFCNLLVIFFLHCIVRSGPILYHVWDATASDSRFSHHIQDTNPGSCDQGRKCKA